MERFQYRFMHLLVIALAVSGNHCITNPIFGLYPPEDDSSDTSSLLLLLLAAGTGGGDNFNTTFSVSSASIGGGPYAMRCDTNYVWIGGEDRVDGNAAWRLEKRNAVTGELDASFATGGIYRSNPSADNNERIQSIMHDGTYIYIFGSDLTGSGSRWRVEKLDSNSGGLASGFGSGGVLQHDPTGGQTDNANAAVFTNGALYLAGSSSTGGSAQEWRIEKRNTTDGGLDTSFNGSGFVTVAAGGGTQSQIFDVAVDGSYLYLAGAHRAANVRWRLDRRSTVDGSPDPAFSGGGSIAVNPTAMLDQSETVTFDSSGVYFSGSQTGNNTIRIEKRDASGANPASFDGGDGRITDDVSAGSDQVRDLLAWDGALYVLGYDESTSTASAQWRISRRDATTGALDASFGSNGTVHVDASTSTDQAQVGCIVSESIFVAGTDNSTTPTTWRLDKRNRHSGSL